MYVHAAENHIEGKHMVARVNTNRYILTNPINGTLTR